MKTVFFAHNLQEDPQVRKSYLELTGYQVELFRGSRSLFGALKTRMPDLVLLDVLIEGKNGFETAAEVRERVGDGIPIVLCSQLYQGEPFKTHAKEVGCDAFLTLPVQMGEFLGAIQAVTKRAQERVATSVAEEAA